MTIVQALIGLRQAMLEAGCDLDDDTTLTISQKNAVFWERQLKDYTGRAEPYLTGVPFLLVGFKIIISS